jgi:anti-sigma B factor antagonist
VPERPLTLSRAFPRLPHTDKPTNQEEESTKMNAKINIRHVQGITFLDISGRIALGEGAVTLRDAIQDALDTGTKKIVLNLCSVCFMDSSGLGELATAYVSARDKGCELKLLGLTKKIDYLIQITKLATLFDVYYTEQEALSYLAR